MIDKIEQIVHGKTPGWNNPEAYVLTDSRFDT